MAAPISVADLLALSLEERIRLVQDLWDSVAEFPEAVSLTDAQRRELDARWEALQKDPSSGRAWDQVKARLQKRQ
ncbi:MAG: addiction module protein [Phycisphaerae bacterium]